MCDAHSDGILYEVIIVFAYIYVIHILTFFIIVELYDMVLAKKCLD